MEDVPVASESRTGYGNDRRAFTQPTFGERSFGTNNALLSSSWRRAVTYPIITDRGADRFTPREQLPLPNKPPYTAHLGNLPFDATNFDVEEFFQGCEVTSIRIVEDKIERKPKGFGYVEFKSVDGLKKALTLDGTQFRGRNIRISVAEPRKTFLSSLSADKDKIMKTTLTWRTAKNDRQEARELNDWTRKGPLPDLPQQRRASDRGGFNKGYEAAPEMERGGSRRGAPAFEGDGKVRDFNNWERKGPLSPLPAPAGVPPVRDGGRVRDGPPKERKLSPSWGPGEGRDGSRPPRGEFRDRPHYDRQPTPAELDNQWRSRMRPDPPVKSSNTPTPEPSSPSSPAQPPPPAVRPKLNLQKRTVSEAEPAAPAVPADAKSSPFGAARPIDTAAREREIEEKMQLQLRLKKEAEEKAREEKRTKEAATKAAVEEQATTPIQENGKETEGEPKENGNAAPAPARSYHILSRVDDEGNEVASEQGNAEEPEPANGEKVQDKDVKPREFIREPPKGPKAQQHHQQPHRDWRRKSSAPNTPVSPSGTAATLEDDGWSTVPAKNSRGRGRGRGGGHHDNAGARAIAS